MKWSWSGPGKDIAKHSFDLNGDETLASLHANLRMHFCNCRLA